MMKCLSRFFRRLRPIQKRQEILEINKIPINLRRSNKRRILDSQLWILDLILTKSWKNIPKMRLIWVIISLNTLWKNSRNKIFLSYTSKTSLKLSKRMRRWTNLSQIRIRSKQTNFSALTISSITPRKINLWYIMNTRLLLGSLMTQTISIVAS